MDQLAAAADSAVAQGDLVAPGDTAPGVVVGVGVGIGIGTVVDMGEIDVEAVVASSWVAEGSAHPQASS